MASLPSAHTILWGTTVATYLVGDLHSTQAMLDEGNREANPVVRQILEQAGNAGFVATKVALLVGAFYVSRRLPDPYWIGIPLGLTLVGTAATVNNYKLANQ